jgi:hypothetical protein
VLFFVKLKNFGHLFFDKASIRTAGHIEPICKRKKATAGDTLRLVMDDGRKQNAAIGIELVLIDVVQNVEDLCSVCRDQRLQANAFDKRAIGDRLAPASEVDKHFAYPAFYIFRFRYARED